MSYPLSPLIMQRFLLFLILLFLPISTVISQNLDSLREIVKKDLPDTTRLAAARVLASSLTRTDEDEALYYAHLSLSLQKDPTKYKLQSELYNNIGTVYFYIPKLDSALYYYRLTYEFSQKAQDSTQTAVGLANVGNVYLRYNDYTKAIDYYLQATKYQAALSTHQVAALYNSIGLIYRRQKNYEKALYFMHLSKDLWEKSTRPDDVSTAYNNIGLTHSMIEQTDSALFYHEKTLVIHKKRGDIKGQAKTLGNIGGAYYEKGEYDKAEKYLLQANELYLTTGKEDKASSRHITLGQVWSAQGKYNEAEKIFFEVLSDSISSKELKMDAYEGLAKTYEKQNKSDKAYNALKSYLSLKDSVYSETQAEETARMQSLLQTERQTQEIENLKKTQELSEAQAEEEKSRNQLIIASLGAVGLILGVLMAFALWNIRIRKRHNLNLSSKNTEINQQKEEIITQRDNLEEQKEKLLLANENIKTLAEIGQQITATLDIVTLVATLHEHVNSLMPAEGFGIGVYNPDTNRLEFKGFLERGKELPFHTDAVSHNNSLAVMSLLKQKEIVVNNINQEYTDFGLTEINAQVGEIPQSLIYVPLVMENKSIGVITVQSFTAGVYEENHLSILRSLASYTTIALDNTKAYELIEQKNNKITDSIRYAKTIQEAILPTQEHLSNLLGNFFLVFMPKDIVSGDFYWIDKKDEYIFLAVADCTGHGVPGAFMSLVGNNMLNEIVREEQEYEPERILKRLNERIRLALRQEEDANRDGMDIGICRFKQLPNGKTEMAFAGAKRPLYVVTPENEEVEIIKGVRKSIGGMQRKMNSEYEQTTNEYPEKTWFYLSTDGLADQSNPEKQKFSSLHLIEIIKENQHQSAENQKRIIEEKLNRFQKNEAQRDDITLLGVQF